MMLGEIVRDDIGGFALLHESGREVARSDSRRAGLLREYAAEIGFELVEDQSVVPS